MIKIGSQFSGVGSFNQALERLKIEYNDIYAAEWDKYSRQVYLHNFKEPEYYVNDVYDTPIEEITEKHGSLDILMTSPPCQSFSMAGKRLGKDDPKGRGILFFESLRFIEINKPKYFIFENVKGLLSHDKTIKENQYGNTFSEWINYLGGKSVNGNSILFPFEGSVPYHIHWSVLNAKDYGIPQNRERVFIIGIREDLPNDFRFPKVEPLTKRLKDVLEPEVDEKYYLSEKSIKHIYKKMGVYTGLNEEITRCLTTRYSASIAGTFIEEPKIFAMLGRNIQNESNTEQQIEINEKGISNSLTTVQKDNLLIEPISHSLFPRSSKTGKGGTGHLTKNDGTSYCIDTGCSQAIEYSNRIRKLTPRECFRLMDFNEDFIENTINSNVVSNSQLYKQAGNSICVGVLERIIKNLNL